ncbi:hypothetical protein AB0M44_46195 [Streptosporangium subroseum]|uniref:hypothetical protein n=1 Tax=Streptosporangium subroseum TaxID=106412 RepID=UPI00341D36EA
MADSVRLIRALLTLVHLLHVDETTTRIGTARRWLHVACTPRLTLLGLGPRSRQGANSLGVLGGVSWRAGARFAVVVQRLRCRAASTVWRALRRPRGYADLGGIGASGWGCPGR